MCSESAAQLSKLREDILKGVTQLMEKGSNQESRTEADAVLVDSMVEVKQSLKALSSMMAAVPKENIILQSIFFSSMNHREESMESASDGTFDWIFEEKRQRPSDDEDNSDDHSDDVNDEARGSQSDPDSAGDANPEAANNVDNSLPTSGSRPPSPDADESAPETSPPRAPHHGRGDRIRQEELERRALARDNFTAWLRSRAGVFHISGKAGSGKSTLMKFLCSHKRTREELRIWAGEGRKPVFARFYFWKSSKENMQMSLPGLHRSILFETLKHCPDLIPALFRRQWEILSGNIPYVVADLVSDSDAQEAFEALTTKGSFPKHPFYFFVDGLDEYHGQLLHQLKLSRDLQRWASGGDVKICASSRPYIQFDKLVTLNDRRIHLHELTRHDIYLFSRKLIEDSLKDDLERIDSYYLRLVEKVVDRSEGVFLWARLVVCSVLEGLLRYDTEDALERKLRVLPPDINDLYTELLGALSPDNRVRAEKMLLLTAHSPSWPPLSSVAYAFIDDLGDPDFPPRNGKKPNSWRSTEEVADDVQLQLWGLTRGLLETAPMADTRRAVQFFHRTARDFALEHSKLDNTADRFPWITKGETYYRLWLAELILTDLPAREEVWYYDSSSMDSQFRQEIPPNLLEGFSCIIKNEDTVSIDVPMNQTFQGGKCAPTVWYYENELSFINLAAYCGQRIYVMQQTTKSPELLRSCGKFHVLLSAALGAREDLVSDLLERGSSPLDCVECQLTETTSFDSIDKYLGTQTIPLWIVFTTHLVAYRLSLAHREVQREVQREVLELLLQDERIDASNVLFLVRKSSKAPITHFITLRQFVDDLRPQNADRLLALLDRGKGNAYVNSARRFLSKYTPLFQRTEYMAETRGYTRLHMTSSTCGWSYGLGIFSNTRLQVPHGRTY